MAVFVDDQDSLVQGDLIFCLTVFTTHLLRFTAFKHDCWDLNPWVKMTNEIHEY